MWYFSLMARSQQAELKEKGWMAQGGRSFVKLEDDVDRADWCRVRFAGWDVACTAFKEAREYPGESQHGHVAVRSACGVLVIGKVTIPKKHADLPMGVYFGHPQYPVFGVLPYGGTNGLRWWAMRHWERCKRRLEDPGFHKAIVDVVCNGSGVFHGFD